MKFVVGCDLEEFKRYYRALDALHNYFRALGLTDVRFGELGPIEEGHIKRDPSHLIVWREDNEIIGNAVWHETHIDEFRDTEDKEVREVLERFLGEKKEFIEAMAKSSLNSLKGSSERKVMTQLFIILTILLL